MTNCKNWDAKKGVRVNVRLTPKEAQMLDGIDKSRSKAFRKVLAWFDTVKGVGK